MTTSEFVDGSAWMKPPVDGPALALTGAVLLVLGIGYVVVSIVRLVLRRMRSVTLPEVAR